MATYTDILTSGRTTAQTVTDIDGLLKWALHNLFINSATGATQGVTVVSGADYTVAFKGTGSITYSGAASGTLNGTGASDLVSVEVTASTTTLTCTVSGSITDVRVYRSDLGGLQLNSDGTGYVATGGSAVYFPGIAYDANGVCLGIQSFESRTNILTQSNDVSNAAWTKTNCATLAKDVSGVDGNTSGVTIQDNNAGGSGAVTVRQNVTVSTSTTYTYWRWLKADQLDWALLRGSNFTTPADGGVWFDLTNGTVGTENTGYTGNITSYANGYYRCEITFTTDASDTAGTVWIYACDADNDAAVDLDGTSSIIDGGGQLEVGNRASPNIPTFASSVTRGGDDMSKAVSEFSYSQTEGTVVVEFRLLEDAISSGWSSFSLNDDTSSNRIEQRQSASDDRVSLVVRDSGVTVVNMFGDVSGATEKVRAAIAFAENDFAMSVNGSAVQTDTSGTVPTVTQIQIGQGREANAHLNGYITSVKVYTDRVPNAKLVEASTL